MSKRELIILGTSRQEDGQTRTDYSWDITTRGFAFFIDGDIRAQTFLHFFCETCLPLCSQNSSRYGHPQEPNMTTFRTLSSHSTYLHDASINAVQHNRNRNLYKKQLKNWKLL